MGKYYRATEVTKEEGVDYRLRPHGSDYLEYGRIKSQWPYNFINWEGLDFIERIAFGHTSGSGLYGVLYG